MDTTTRDRFIDSTSAAHKRLHAPLHAVGAATFTLFRNEAIYGHWQSICMHDHTHFVNQQQPNPKPLARWLYLLAKVKGEFEMLPRNLLEKDIESRYAHALPDVLWKCVCASDRHALLTGICQGVRQAGNPQLSYYTPAWSMSARASHRSGRSTAVLCVLGRRYARVLGYSGRMLMSCG